MCARILTVIALCLAFAACGDEPEVNVGRCRSACDKVEECVPSTPDGDIAECRSDCTELGNLSTDGVESCVEAFNAFNGCIVNESCSAVERGACRSASERVGRECQ